MRLIRSIRFVCRLQSSRRYFFSIAQLNATSQLIFVSDREYVLAGAYYTMVVIQITAFMMTLRKKGFMYVLVQAGVRVEPCLYLGATATCGGIGGFTGILQIVCIIVSSLRPAPL